jgi:TrmH family RNA methyltransferase
VLSKTRFQALQQFNQKKERAGAGVFFVEGWRWLEEAVNRRDGLDCVLATRDAARDPAEVALLERARAAARESFEVTPEQLGKLTDNISAPGVAALVRWRPATMEQLVAGMAPNDPALAVALDAVGDPGNAGTIVRTADWFGAAAVVFCTGSVEPTNPKALRATMGSLFHLPIADGAFLPQALTQLRVAGFVAVGAALDGDELSEFAWPKRTVLVVGSEANGIQPDVLMALDRRVRIPGYGRAESLNAAVAAAVLMADWRRSFASKKGK